MAKFNYIVAIFSILFVSLLSAQSVNTYLPATSATSAPQLLQGYNVSNSTILSLTYSQIFYGGGNYLLAYQGSNPQFLINTTGGTYKLVLNSTQISSIINNFVIQSSLSQINTTYLQKSMVAYNQSSAGSLENCTVGLGLVDGETNRPTGVTCTLANNCQSCLTVPLCSASLIGSAKNFGGVAGQGFGSSFEYALIGFSAQWGFLESNLTNYFSNVSAFSSTHSQTNLNNIRSTFENVSNITSFIVQNNNQIFPPPPNADQQVCVTDPNAPYCSNIPICTFLTYNYTLLNNMQIYLTRISSLATSSQQVNQVALNISTNEYTYVAPLLAKGESVQVAAIINTTLPGYNGMVSGATNLLTHISNTLLSQQLVTLQANYSVLVNNYVSINISGMNKTLARQYSAFRITYNSLNATYSSVLNLAANNTVTLVELQVGNTNPSPTITTLSFQQATLNSQLGGSIKNVSTLNSKLLAINKQLNSLSNNPSLLQSMARAIDAPVATGLLGLVPNTYSTGLKVVTFLSLIPVILLGIVLLIAISLYRRGLAKSNRIAYNNKTRKNWSRLFILAIVLILLAIVVTLLASFAANETAPISAFVSSVHSAKSVVIALNGTNNTAMVNCANKVATSLKALNKTSKIITISGIACNNGIPLETTEQCLATYAENSTPVIIFTNSSADTITSYSYYGSMLDVNGNPQFMSTCIVSTMIR